MPRLLPRLRSGLGGLSAAARRGRTTTSAGNRNVWVYWENPPGAGSMPDYIRLCLETLSRHNPHLDVHVLNERTVRDHLPDLGDRYENILARHKGVVATSIAHKVDFIRAHLLQRHGGLYLDADAIIFRRLDPLLDALADREFVHTRLLRFGENVVPNGVMASRPGGRIIDAYVEALTASYVSGKVFQWTELGSALLTPIVDQHPESARFVDEAKLLPIAWQEKREFGHRRPLGELVPSNAFMLMLFHGAFEGRIGAMKETELLDRKTVVGQAFRQALGL